MTIPVLFHQSGYRNLKQFYLEFVGVYLLAEFPGLVSYNRFARFERDALLLLAAYLQTKRGDCTGISFVDSTKLAVCTNLRIPRHKQFADFAGRGKTSARVGSMVSNCTLLFPNAASCFRGLSLKAMLTTAVRFSDWQKDYGANSSAIKVMFQIR